MLSSIKRLLQRSSLYIAVFVTVFITYLSLAKIGPQPISFNHLDKIEHAIAYATLSFFWLLSFGTTKKKINIIIGVCIAYGAVIEVLQSTTAYRTFDYADMIANAIGVLLGMLFFKFFTKNKNLTI